MVEHSSNKNFWMLLIVAAILIVGLLFSYSIDDECKACSDERDEFFRSVNLYLKQECVNYDDRFLDQFNITPIEYGSVTLT